MEPFALSFMLVSMVVVTALAAYCLWRVLRGGWDRPSGEE
jgi:ABC-type nickel/cobalt efflux system permease component RcnA